MKVCLWKVLTLRSLLCTFLMRGQTADPAIHEPLSCLLSPRGRGQPRLLGFLPLQDSWDLTKSAGCKFLKKQTNKDDPPQKSSFEINRCHFFVVFTILLTFFMIQAFES